MQTEGEANALKFSQIFHLAPAAGSYVVSNGEDLFLLLRIESGLALVVDCFEGCLP